MFILKQNSQSAIEYHRYQFQFLIGYIWKKSFSPKNLLSQQTQKHLAFHEITVRWNDLKSRCTVRVCMSKHTAVSQWNDGGLCGHLCLQVPVDNAPVRRQGLAAQQVHLGRPRHRVHERSGVRVLGIAALDADWPVKGAQGYWTLKFQSLLWVDKLDISWQWFANKIKNVHLKQHMQLQHYQKLCIP